MVHELKKMLLLGCCVLPLMTGAAEWYVSPSGKDTNAGTKDAPLHTIQDAVDRMIAGDTCYVRAGTYHESVEFRASGTPDKPICLQAYSNEQVIIDGTSIISNPWKKHKDNIYKTPVMGTVEQLFIDREMMIEARWPNMTFEQHFDRSCWAKSGEDSTHGLMFSKEVAESGIDWTGATACLNVAHQWWTWNRPITKHKTGSDRLEYPANLVGLCNYDPAYEGPNNVSEKGWKDDYFYLFGKLEALDVENEWYYDRKAKMLYFRAPGSIDPFELNVSWKSQDYGIHAKNKNDLKICGINFFANTFLLEDCNRCLIENCELLYPTYSRTITEYNADRHESVITKIVGNNNTVRHCSLAYANNMGLMMMGNSNTVENCIIHDVNWFGTLIYPALQLSSSPHLGVNWFDTIQYPPTPCTPENADITSYGNRAISNTLFNCGNALLVYHAANSMVEYNHVYSGGKACKDVSLIYGCWPFSRGSTVRYNWVHDCYPDHGGIGIRADDQSRNNTFHHNVVWDCGGVGIVAKGENHRIYNNTIFNIGGNGNRMDCIYAPIGPEPVKQWASQWPQLQAQNQKTPIINNFSYNLKYLGGKKNILEESERIHHNLTGKKIPQVIDISKRDFRPAPDSELVDAGIAIPGITDGFSGKAPDIGAYDANGERWVPGANWKESFTKID